MWLHTPLLILPLLPPVPLRYRLLVALRLLLLVMLLLALLLAVSLQELASLSRQQCTCGAGVSQSCNAIRPPSLRRECMSKRVWIGPAKLGCTLIC